MSFRVVRLLMRALMIIDQASRLSHTQRVGGKGLSKCPQRKFEKRAKGDLYKNIRDSTRCEKLYQPLIVVL